MRCALVLASVASCAAWNATDLLLHLLRATEPLDDGASPPIEAIQLTCAGCINGCILDNECTDITEDECDGRRARWCSRPNAADHAAVAVQATPTTTWSCVATPHGTRAMNIDANGDVACWAQDGVNCVTNTPCDVLIKDPAGPARPLSCGCSHKVVWGVTGYDTPNHWCNVGVTALGARPPTGPCTTSQPSPVPTTQHPTTRPPLTTIALTPAPTKDYTKEWLCVPFAQGGEAIRIDANGDVSCWAQDGRNCVRTPNCDTLIKDPQGAPKPLSCGCMHNQIYGSTGYDNPAHWCTRGIQQLGATPSYASCTTTTTPTTIPTPVSTTPGITSPVTTSPAPVSTTPVTTSPVTTSPAPVSTTPVTTSPVTTSPAPVSTTPVTTSPVTTSPAPVSTTPVTTSPVTTSPAPVSTTPVTTSPVTTSPVTTSPVTTSPVTTPGVSTFLPSSSPSLSAGTPPRSLPSPSIAPPILTASQTPPLASPDIPQAPSQSSQQLSPKELPQEGKAPSLNSKPPTSSQDLSNPDNDASIEAPPPFRPPGPRTNSNEGGLNGADSSTTYQANTQSSIALLGSDDPVNQAGRIVFNSVVAGTLVVLTAFHFTAMDPSVVPSASFGDSLWAPNLWELPTFFTFLQNMAIVAMASIDSPYAPFALFTDSFSWLLFLVKGGASGDSAAARMLEATAYDAFGIQQFALRLNIRESELFVRAWTFFFLVVSAVLLLLCLFTGLGQCFSRHGGPHLNEVNSTDAASQHNAERFEKWAQKVRGGFAWILTQSVLPLTAVSVFEATYKAPGTLHWSASSVLAFAILVVIGGVCVGTSVVLWRQSETSLSKYKTKAAFGVLYVNLRFQFRAFCGATLLVQFLSGVFMSGFVHPSTQMLWLIAIHTAYMFVLVAVRPFVTTMHLGVAVVVELVNIAIYGLCFAQANAPPDDLETKKRLGYAVMGLACLLVVLFFARTLVKLGKKLTGKDEKIDDSDRSLMREVTLASPLASSNGVVLRATTHDGPYEPTLSTLVRLPTSTSKSPPPCR